MTQSVSIDAAGATSVGKERNHNEDQYLIADLARAIRIRSSTVFAGKPAWLPTSEQGTLLIVADGMGGQGGGDKASMIAVRTVAKHLARVMPWIEEKKPAEASAQPDEDERQTRESIPQIRRRMESALIHGAEAIEAAAKGTKSPSMGTTLTAAFVRFPTVYLAHVGDSRGYLLRGKEMFQLTHDHTMAERLRTEIGARIDESSPWNHVLWNALGGGGDAELAPEVQRLDVEEGDVILLCSDGLTKHVDDATITRVLEGYPSAQKACDVLVEAANEGGGSDNITVVIARCGARG